MPALLTTYSEKLKDFFPIMSVRTKLIVLTVLCDDYFKLNFHWPKLIGGGG